MVIRMSDEKKPPPPRKERETGVALKSLPPSPIDVAAILAQVQDLRAG